MKSHFHFDLYRSYVSLSKMKSIGTISLYYPFLTDEIKEVIESIVNESGDYRDFVVNIVEESKNHPISSDLVFFSIIHAITYQDCWQKMKKRCSESVLTRPFLFFKYEDQVLKEDQNKAAIALQQAIDATSDNWILFHLYVLGVWILGEPNFSKYVELARESVEKQHEMRRFLPLIAGSIQYSLRSQGDVDGAISVLDESLEIAKEYDDILEIVSLLAIKGNIIKDFDVHKGLEILDEAYTMAKTRDSRRNAVTAVAIIMAIAYEALGEYDMALELVREEFEVISSYSETPRMLTSLVAARIHNALEQPKESIEWLQIYSKSFEFDHAQLNSSMALALLLKNELDRAAGYLNIAQRQAMDSGNEQDMMSYLYVQGLLDLALGNITSARELIQQCLEMGDSHFQITVNECLIALTKVEISELVNASQDDRDAETSGPWMTRLRKHVYQKNYLGIKIKYALLKAEYQVAIGEHEAAKQTLINALEITDSMTVKTMRARVINRLKELERAQIT
ncbi:MAG: hypothetical protein OEV85_11430 [Candidatus Thorarchaeota archaeon]|nr:hypothetical protein [Candidatus Thorarchaeota archaeon]